MMQQLRHTKKKKRRRRKKFKKQLLLHTNDIFPNDIVIEILSWLPAKSLLRFRWTCKYWFDLIASNIDHHDFIKMHLHRSTTTTSISSSVLSFCFMNYGDSYYKKLLSQGSYHLNYNGDTNYDIPGEVNHIGDQLIHGILGSSNGLILLITTTAPSKNKHLCILNPCTKEYKVVPSPLYNEERYYYNTNYYNTNLVVLGDTYGFGYDQTIDDYKVIRIKHYNLHGDDLLRFNVQVYTLGTNSWRRIMGSNIPYRLQDCWLSSGVFLSGVFLNGVIYWIDSLHHNIISFDIGKETFHHVSRTPHFAELPQLQVFEGSLCLVLTINHHRNSPVEIWVMKKDYTVNNNNNESIWTQLLTIPYYYSIKLLLRYSRNNEILMLNTYKDLVLYDPKNTSYQTLGRICEDRNHFLVLEVYTESLISLNSGTYSNQQPKEEHNMNKRKKI